MLSSQGGSRTEALRRRTGHDIWHGPRVRVRLETTISAGDLGADNEDEGGGSSCGSGMADFSLVPERPDTIAV